MNTNYYEISIMNTCPKCGAPQASELTLDGFALRKAMWFDCGSHALLDEPEKIVSRSNRCCDQERINDLQTMREQYLIHLMETKANLDQLMGENSQQAERIRDLEEHSTKQNYLIDELADSLRKFKENPTKPKKAMESK